MKTAALAVAWVLSWVLILWGLDASTRHTIPAPPRGVAVATTAEVR